MFKQIEEVIAGILCVSHNQEYKVYLLKVTQFL